VEETLGEMKAEVKDIVSIHGIAIRYGCRDPKADLHSTGRRASMVDVDESEMEYHEQVHPD